MLSKEEPGGRRIRVSEMGCRGREAQKHDVHMHVGDFFVQLAAFGLGRLYQGLELVDDSLDALDRKDDSRNHAG